LTGFTGRDNVSRFFPVGTFPHEPLAKAGGVFVVVCKIEQPAKLVSNIKVKDDRWLALLAIVHRGRGFFATKTTDLCVAAAHADAQKAVRSEPFFISRSDKNDQSFSRER
jgi:hypothetical protein